MTLINAIKSKLPFKRPCWSAYISVTDQDLFEIREISETKLVATLDLYLNDLVADDYVLMDSTNTHMLNKNLSFFEKTR